MRYSNLRKPLKVGTRQKFFLLRGTWEKKTVGNPCHTVFFIHYYFHQNYVLSSNTKKSFFLFCFTFLPNVLLELNCLLSIGRRVAKKQFNRVSIPEVFAPTYCYIAAAIKTNLFTLQWRNNSTDNFIIEFGWFHFCSP